MISLKTQEFESQIGEFIQDNDKYKLINYAIEVNGAQYFYVYLYEKGHLIFHQNGTVITREKALPILKKFIKFNTAILDILEEGDLYAKRNVKIFDNLFRYLQTLQQKFSHRFRQVEQEIEGVKKVVTQILKGQERIKEIVKESAEMKKEKCEERGYILNNDIKRMQDLSDELDWILYTQGKMIEESIDQMNQIQKVMKTEFHFLKRNFDKTLLSVKLLIKQFTSKEVIRKNRESLQTFEVNSSGQGFTFSNGELVVIQLKGNKEEKFNTQFEKYYLPYLRN